MPRATTWETVREIALALLGVEEGTSYGTPAFKVKGKLFVRLKEDGETLVVKIGFDEREMLLEAAPETFFLTDHYRGYPYVLVRLGAIDRDRLREILEESWRETAPKRLKAEQERRLG